MYAVETGTNEAWRTKRSFLNIQAYVLLRLQEVTVRVNNVLREQERGNHTFKHTKTSLGQTLKNAVDKHP